MARFELLHHRRHLRQRLGKRVEQACIFIANDDHTQAHQSNDTHQHQTLGVTRKAKHGDSEQSNNQPNGRGNTSAFCSSARRARLGYCFIPIRSSIRARRVFKNSLHEPRTWCRGHCHCTGSEWSQHASSSCWRILDTSACYQLRSCSSSGSVSIIFLLTRKCFYFSELLAPLLVDLREITSGRRRNTNLPTDQLECNYG